MALQPQPQAAPPAGGLNQASPPQPAQPPKQENLTARAAGMEQEETTAPEDFFTKTMRDLQTQRSALNAQTEKLLASLDARQNRLFDPVLMKAAAGFAKPTKTGSFGESLGYAMEGAAEEAEKEFARQQVTEKLKQELLQKQMEQAQLQARQSFLASKMSPQGVPTPSGPSTSISAPTGAASQRAPGVPMAAQAGVQVAAAPSPAGCGLTIGSEDIKQAMLVDPSGKDAQALRELMKAEIDRARMLQETDPNRPVKVDFGPLFGAPKEVPYSTYAKWLEIHNSGDRAKELQFFYDRNWIKRPPGAKEPINAEERAAAAKVIEAFELERIKEESSRIGKLLTNFETSRDFINAAMAQKNLATSNPRAFDLMNDDGVATAVMRTVKAGIQAGNFGAISIPADVAYQGVKLSKEDREALQLFAQEYANLTVQFRKAARVPGEGAYTEREGDLYAALGALPTDTARVIRMKAEFIELRGKYDQEVFRAWNKFSEDRSKSYSQFLVSNELQDIKNAYDARLGEIQRANAKLLKPREKNQPKKSADSAPPAARQQPASKPAAQPSTSGPPSITGNDDPVYKNLQPGQLYIAPDGTVRTKR